MISRIGSNCISCCSRIPAAYEQRRARGQVADRRGGPARPFLKWAGGKGKLIEQFEPRFPPELKEGGIRTFVEPFVGAGAVFFHVAREYPIEKAYLSDINEELVLTYKVIKKHVGELIDALESISVPYRDAAQEKRERLYYKVREQFNHAKASIDYGGRITDASIERAAQVIFLNKTCFNGLFRTNSSGGFNVPFGRYKRPGIFSPENLKQVSQLLRKARADIVRADFEECAAKVDGNTFVYFDPPYRPLSTTSNFTSYSRGGFDDSEQQRLARFFARLAGETGAKLMLSNSDPANVNPRDRFFHNLYKGFTIDRVYAARSINSNAQRRGGITELVITNYPLKAQ
ncbi:MAG: Dam family site-specific DNA-(adenine-N6)-methyltransferase [Chitinivibrionales bacterium]|nr:Dam family site-specific DNA-(adenine-N6)-methyltransferase [Chitinivibrionales bacterium]